MEKFNKGKDDLFQKAIIFLVENFIKTGNNPKPVITHSIRVASILEQFNQDIDTIVAGVLHDILEDTQATQEDIKEIFGSKIAKLVESLTFDKNITDKTAQYKEAFDRSLKEGSESLTIRAIDIYTNSYFYKLNPDNPSNFKYVMGKFKYFLDISKNKIDKPVYNLINNRYKELNK